MPDLFDGFFTKLGAKLNGGHTRRHYGGDSQVNTGKFYSYHSSASNNNYWLPRKPSISSETEDAKLVETQGTRDGKMSLDFNDDMSAGVQDRSRFNSVASEK
ncbi:uncharacterized protein LODBEIA_P34990 [Lodderomyces beijingensis]|uniref:Stationary phase protein 4 n=1 Tax=Lodderomyces beijingensis TaxID=1775926 RepID=A0ABP0ZPZ2_9ASCO